MTIVEEYLELTKRYKNEYGEKTLVLMQVGSFFEAYGLMDKDNVIYGSEIVKFAEINEAYETLGDETKKRVYDTTGMTGDE